MRALITGGSGFIGAYVVARLTDAGHDVTVYDVAPPATAVDYVEGDVRDAEMVRKAVAAHDVVCHLAAMAALEQAMHDLAGAAAVNVAGSANVAEAALAEGARLVYASTWEVYGEPVSQPAGEDHPCRPEHPYGITKLAGEQIVLAAAEFHGLSAVSLRLATTYGLGLRRDSVFEIFRRRAAAGQGIEIHGDGTQFRQFLHARDAAKAVELALQSDVSGMAFNVAPEQTVTIGELAEIVASRFDVPVTFGQARLGDAVPMILSTERIRAELGWDARESFAAGLTRLLDGVDDRH